MCRDIDYIYSSILGEPGDPSGETLFTSDLANCNKPSPAIVTAVVSPEVTTTTSPSSITDGEHTLMCRFAYVAESK